MFYRDQRAILTSKHQKERVIAPVFQDILACHVDVADVDTDQFGTFTGEVTRTASAYDTCILKAKYGAIMKKYNLSIASEGSFGLHPANPLLPHAHEIMVFVDLNREWIIREQLSTTQTNYRMMTIQQDTAMESFLDAVMFPSHALILQSTHQGPSIQKGIRSTDELRNALAQGFAKHHELILATDMRAMFNPTRMQTLAILAEKLALRIKTPCPNCQAPGFGLQQLQGHLPCSSCHENTSEHQWEKWGCIQCNHHEQRQRPDQRVAADPAYCYSCNP